MDDSPLSHEDEFDLLMDGHFENSSENQLPDNNWNNDGISFVYFYLQFLQYFLSD